MKKTALTASLLLLAAQVQADTGAAGWWSSLWRNADQRGEALLQQGQPAAAAQTYADPRRKAQAQFKAGDYAAAAQELSSLNDSEAHYNRGNALAHAGDLAAALKAYDAALKLDPKHADARHNRDLVAKALAQQQAADKNQPQNGQPGQPKDGQPGDQKDKPQDGSQDGEANKPEGQQQKQPSQGSSGDKPGQGQNDKPDAKPGDKAGNKSGSADNNQPAASAQKPGGAASGPQKAGPANPSAASSAANDAEQARRDAQASLQAAQAAKAASAAKGQSTADGIPTGASAARSATPMTENQMAQEQWLRSIPDDPGGLLRRKFMIQHLMRQRDAQP
jgi:Ca-activated chloride channel family protein